MKKILFLSMLPLMVISAKMNYDSKKSAAEANSHQGVYIFTDCKPVSEYKYLGSVKPKGRGWDLIGGNSGQYTDLRDRLIKAAKKNYPDCDGLILELKDGGVDLADVIQFK